MSNTIVNCTTGEITEPALTPDILLAINISNLRRQRNILLRASDIVVMPDRWETYTPSERAAWSSYRQSLRDLPAITPDPSSPVWPVPPGRPTTPSQVP